MSFPFLLPWEGWFVPALPTCCPLCGPPGEQLQSWSFYQSASRRFSLFIVMKASRVCHRLLCVSQGGLCSRRHVWIPNRLPLTFWPTMDFLVHYYCRSKAALSPSHLQRRTWERKTKAAPAIQPFPYTSRGHTSENGRPHAASFSLQARVWLDESKCV